MKSLMLFRCKFLAELPVLMSKKNMKNMVHQSRIFHKMINEYICISFFFSLARKIGKSCHWMAKINIHQKFKLFWKNINMANYICLFVANYIGTLKWF